MSLFNCIKQKFSALKYTLRLSTWNESHLTSSLAKGRSIFHAKWVSFHLHSAKGRTTFYAKRVSPHFLPYQEAYSFHSDTFFFMSYGKSNAPRKGESGVELTSCEKSYASRQGKGEVEFTSRGKSDNSWQGRWDGIRFASKVVFPQSVHPILFFLPRVIWLHVKRGNNLLILTVNNFLTNDERWLKSVGDHIGLWLWQHTSRSRSLELIPLF